LLPKSKDFQDGIALGTEENSECSKHREEELDHELTGLTWRKYWLDQVGSSH